MVTTALFTVTLTVAGVALIFTVGKSLLNTLDSSAERTGGEVAALVKENKLPTVSNRPVSDVVKTISQ